MSAFRVGTSKVGGTDLLGGATTGGPPSRVKSVGSNTSGSSGTTIAVTVPAGGVTAGNHVLIGLAWSGATSVTLSSVTDSRGNTYQTDRAQAASGANGAIVSALIGTALQSGDTITATLSAAATHRLMTVDEISGMPTSSWLDQATSATGTSTTPSSGSVTTTSANEYLFAVASIDTATANTYAPDGSWGEDYELHTTSKGIEVAHQTATSTGSFTASGVLGSSVLWSQLVATYKSSGGGASQALAGTSAGSSTTAGALTVTQSLAATSAGTSAATGAVSITAAFAGTSAGSSTTTGDLTAGPLPQVLRPAADSVDGAWTTDTGGTDLAAAIDETTPNDTDYIRSEVAPANSACRLKLAAGNDPLSSTGHVIRWRGGKEATGAPRIDLTVSLRQGGGNTLGGGTLIAAFTRTDVDTLTTYEETLSGTQADAITDYADLYLEVTGNQV